MGYKMLTMGNKFGIIFHGWMFTSDTSTAQYKPNTSKY